MNIRDILLIIIIIYLIISYSKKNKYIENFAFTNDDKNEIRTLIKEIYNTDMDAIRRLAKLADDIQLNGLKVNGDLNVTGSINSGSITSSGSITGAGNLNISGSDNKISEFKIQSNKIGARSGYLSFDNDTHIRHLGYSSGSHDQRFATGSLWSNGGDGKNNDFGNRTNVNNTITSLSSKIGNYMLYNYDKALAIGRIKKEVNNEYYIMPSMFMNPLAHDKFWFVENGTNDSNGNKFYYMYYNYLAQYGSLGWHDRNTYSTSDKFSADEFEGMPSNDVIGNNGSWNRVGVKL
jgi:hypothetical protein